ncbi:glycosyltransferase family 4 protein [Roseomonas sp. SSH11]|uniref:Glycosyltransferase family 4 protein n=1 Tax=Pararoseomonas baculiformis TaxID=2820812 RepID=A0ABS4ACR2_9PROT|nr:glycosyltransferase family 4 protein [Pararoseomonas baculiformis]MBP0444039.1 glycosyltransferase family 4 protein [Pararoseomonas baculiformis]
MRVALLMSHADRSMAGALRDMHFMRLLAEGGAEIAVFRMHPGGGVERERFLDGAVPVCFAPSDNPKEIPHRQVSAKLVEEVRAFAPDAILLKGLSYRVNQDLHDALLPGAAAPPRIGFVVGGSVTDPLLDRADFVFGEYQEQLARHFPRFVEAGRAFVMPKYVDLEASRPSKPAQAPLHDIVNVGGLYDKRKNQEDVVPFTDSWRVALVGGGTPRPEVKAAVADTRNLTMTGRLPQEEVIALLRRCRVMVHTSKMDGLPRAVVEAMACGLPVIVYRDTVHGGFAEGQHGFMVGRDTLRHAVELLLREEPLRRAIGRRARRHAELNHGLPALERAATAFLGFLAQSVPVQPVLG